MNMLDGHDVEVILEDGDPSIHGELRSMDETGVYVFAGYGWQAAVEFIPMRRVKSVRDKGSRPR